MKNDRSTKKRPIKRWEHFQDLPVQFPAPLGPGPTQESRPPTPTEHTDALASDGYPMLRVWLRDRGLSFKPTYSQCDVAMIIGKTDKTVRSRTRKKQIPFHCWPWGEMYYTPQDLEDLLSSCEPGKRGVK